MSQSSGAPRLPGLPFFMRIGVAHLMIKVKQPSAAPAQWRYTPAAIVPA